MLKRLLKIFGGLIAFIVIIVIIAGVALMLFVNKGLIEGQMEKALSRHVEIKKISVGIFSIVSGVEVMQVKISNYKSPRELEALKGKPVPPGDIFVSMESLRLKLRLRPLLKKQFEIKELVLYGPVVNVVKSKDGAFNFDDLMRKKKPAGDETAKLEKKKSGQAAEPKKPFTADDIPVAVTVGEVGVKDGTLNYHDGKLDQRFQVYKLTALAYDIQIDPQNLEKKDRVKLKIYMAVKSVGPVKTGSVQSFDITLDAAGSAKPFDLKTRRLDPEVSLHAGSPEGEFTGLQILNTIAGNNVLGKYIGDQLSFLKGKQSWKGSDAASVDIWYKGGQARLSKGNLNIKEARLLFGGAVNINTKALDSDLELELKKERNGAVKTGIRKQVESGLKRLGAKKYANPDKIAEAAMKPLVNKEGMISMKFKVTGSMNKPDTALVHPQLGSLDDIIKQVAGDVLIEAGKEAGTKAVEKGGKKLLKKLPKLF